MRGQLPEIKRAFTVGLVVGATFLEISCATEKQPVSVVKDSETQKESAIPWNKQEKWEVGSDMSALTDRAH
jgi:hypothetical protein